MDISVCLIHDFRHVRICVKSKNKVEKQTRTTCSLPFVPHTIRRRHVHKTRVSSLPLAPLFFCNNQNEGKHVLSQFRLLLTLSKNSKVEPTRPTHMLTMLGRSRLSEGGGPSEAQQGTDRLVWLEHRENRTPLLLRVRARLHAGTVGARHLR